MRRTASPLAVAAGFEAGSLLHANQRFMDAFHRIPLLSAFRFRAFALQHRVLSPPARAVLAKFFADIHCWPPVFLRRRRRFEHRERRNRHDDHRHGRVESDFLLWHLYLPSFRLPQSPACGHDGSIPGSQAEATGQSICNRVPADARLSTLFISSASAVPLLSLIHWRNT